MLIHGYIWIDSELLLHWMELPRTFRGTPLKKIIRLFHPAPRLWRPIKSQLIDLNLDQLFFFTFDFWFFFTLRQPNLLRKVRRFLKGKRLKGSYQSHTSKTSPFVRSNVSNWALGIVNSIISRSPVGVCPKWIRSNQSVPKTAFIASKPWIAVYKIVDYPWKFILDWCWERWK